MLQASTEKTEVREWKIFENRLQKIFAVLHRPLDTLSPPVVIVMHGFASSKQGSNRCYVTLAEELAKSKIATLRFDFRGSGDSEGHLEGLDFEDLISDATHVCQSVDQIEGIDCNRMGIFGASLGGSLAVLSAPIHKRAKAIALWAPVASGELWYRDFLQHAEKEMQEDPSHQFENYRGIKLNAHFREQFGKMEAYQALALLQQIPILHMQGERDRVISLAHRDAFQCKASSLCHFRLYPEAQHSLGFASSFPQIVTETVDWFKRSIG